MIRLDHRVTKLGSFSSEMEVVREIAIEKKYN